MAKELTTKSYIDHHLTNLTCGKTPDGGGRVILIMLTKWVFGLSMLILCFGLCF